MIEHAGGAAPARANRFGEKRVLVLLGIGLVLLLSCCLVGGILALTYTSPEMWTFILGIDPKDQPRAGVSEPVHSESYHEYGQIFGSRSKTTEIQKEEAWKEWKGKRVRWEGRVVEVTKSFGSTRVQIKHDRRTLTYDVDLVLRRDQAGKAGDLAKGRTITYTGRLTDRGGAVLSATVEDGVIEEPPAEPVPVEPSEPQ